MYGGVVYGRILDTLIPEWWEEAPVQRWVTRRPTMIITGDPGADRRLPHRGLGGSRPTTGPPPTAPTSTRGWPTRPSTPGPRWSCDTTATGLLREGAAGRDRRGAHRPPRRRPRAPGSSSPATASTRSWPRRPASTATSIPPTSPSASRRCWRCQARRSTQRFDVRDREGVDIEILGCTQRHPRRRVPLHQPRHRGRRAWCSSVPALAAPSAAARGAHRRGEGPSRDRPAAARAASSRSTRAHLIPEGGYDVMPGAGRRRHARRRRRRGALPGRRHLARGRQLRHRLRHRRRRGRRRGPRRRRRRRPPAWPATARRLDANFVLADHKKLRRAADVLMRERMQQRYPRWRATWSSGCSRVENPAPKPGLRRIVPREVKRSGLRVRDLARDASTA